MSICVELTRDREGPSPAAATALAVVGGKARSLLRLAEAGLRVPPAFAVTDALFRRLRAAGPPLPSALRSASDILALDRARGALLATPWPPGFAAELGRHLERLAHGEAGARFSIRSSFLREDHAQETGAGAGIYDSLIGVARNDVATAIGRVLASALSPGAVAYARARGDDPDQQATAILIHRTIDGEASGSAAFDPDGGESPAVEVTAGTLDPPGREAIARALRDLADRHGPVEVEWVSAAGALTYLQLRPYVAPPKVEAWAPAAALGDGDWRWDAAHNPLPLSPAQAGLVAMVDEHCRIGLRQRVAGGYLFYAKDGPAHAETIDPSAIVDAFAALVGTADAGLAALEDPPGLEPALGLFVSFYDRLYGVIQPAARRATRDLEEFLRAHAPDQAARLPLLLAGVPSLAAERLRRAESLARAGSAAAHAAALARYLARFGDEAPVWDVVVPTYREDPTRLAASTQVRALAADMAGSRARHGDDEDDDEDSGARRMSGSATAAAGGPHWHVVAQEIAARVPAATAPTFASLVERARLATAIGEDDDALYARVQAAVRAALRGEGALLTRTGWLADREAIFWLPLELVRRFARGDAPVDRATVSRLVTEAREAHERALRDPPPSGAPARAAGQHLDVVIHGRRASAGRIIGRAFIHRASHRTPDRVSDRTAPQTGAPPRAAPREAGPTRASIVVAATLLPTELPLLQAAGLVVEGGGVLGHVAAQARERGIPALVDAHGATDAISDGDLLLLDADAGQVIRLG